MDFANETVGGRGNDRIATDFLPRLLIFPDIIKARKTKDFLIFQLKIVPGERRFFKVSYSPFKHGHRTDHRQGSPRVTPEQRAGEDQGAVRLHLYR
jgi:hypothetical protein